MNVQLNSFCKSLNEYSKISFPNNTNWFDAFDNLVRLLKNSRKKGKKVVFIDEIPWMDTPKSGFVSAIVSKTFWTYSKY
jgi:hypothetical protein